MYAGATADGECPLVVDDSSPSCGDSRFGCWVCTLVEKDKSMTAMIQNDAEKEWMLPLLDLRNALDFRNNSGGQEEANDHHLRDFRRMTGAVQMMSVGKPVPGPYTQESREQWLRKLLMAQTHIRQHGPTDMKMIDLVTLEELQEIRRIWVMDKHELEDLLQLEGIDSDTARKLSYSGVATREALADLATDDLVDMIGIDQERASQLIMTARAPWFA